MLNVPDEVKQNYLTDSNNKDIVIPFVDDDTDVSGVNWYTGYVAYGITGHLDSAGDIILYCNYDGNTWDTALDDYVYKTYLDKAEYIYVSCKLTISTYTTLPTQMQLACHYRDYDNQGWGGNIFTFNPNNYIDELTSADGLRIYTRLDASKVNTFTELALYCVNGGIDFTYGIGDIQIQSSNVYYSASDFYTQPITNPLPYLGESIIRQGLDPLDFITIGKDPISDITNSDIEYQNFKLQENLCSSDNLKFGACEASYVNFTTYGRNDEFKDREIAPKIITGANPDTSEINWINWYNGQTPAPGNTASFTETSLPANYRPNILSDIRNTNITYFNDYAYVAVKFKVKLTNFTVDSGSAPDWMGFYLRFNAYDASTDTIRDNGIYYSKLNSPSHATQFAIADLQSDYVDCTFYVALKESGKTNYFDINYLKCIRVAFINSSNQYYSASYGTYSWELLVKDVQICIVDEQYETLVAYDVADCLEYNGIDPSIHFGYEIPLGKYTISEVKKTVSHGLTKTEITAYDKLTLLEQNAANWYTLYMYAMSTDDYAKSYSFEFTRQIYSSYFNIMKNLGIEKRAYYDEDVVQNHTDYWGDVQYAYYNNGHKDLTYEVASSRWSTVRYGMYSVSSPDVTKPYVVDLTNYNNQSDDDLKALALDYKQFIDSECRGLIGISNVLIAETIQGSAEQHCFLVDSGDYFMLSSDCTGFDVYFPWAFNNELNNQGGGYVIATGAVKISEVQKDIDLENASTRLLYYGWQSRDIFECESGITARDVVRSLLEVCGCLFKLDRYGMPTFLYPTMNALYPSETLYPEDDLYPRGLDGSLISMGKYKSFEYEDYQVQNIGRIQIIKNINTNDITSICEWEYEGDADEINTYLINDNIFYCNKDLIYDYDNMGDVSQMLINMYSRIANMKYYPHLTKAIGMPWVEVGDRIGLLTTNSGIESFVYRRTLNGVQLLSDIYEAQGDEYTEKVKDYNYTLWEE